MAKGVEEQLTRSRRLALLIAAAILAVPVGFASRGMGEWATFGLAAGLLAVLMIFGTRLVFGPFGKDDTSFLDDTPPEDTPGPGRLHRRKSHEDEQLVLSPQQHAAGSHARTQR